MSNAIPLEQDSYAVAGRKYESRLFHCFGNPGTELSLNSVLGMLKASGTQFLTFNTHLVAKRKDPASLTIGYTGNSIKQLSSALDMSRYTILVNMNLAQSSEEAIRRAIDSSELCNSKIIKLEVLNQDCTLSVNSEVIKAAEHLLKREYEVMPLISPDLEDAKTLQEMGCSLIRVMGSPIGSQRGIENKRLVESIFHTLSVPAILDGGIGIPNHAYEAMKLGAAGVLVNKALFVSGDPLSTLAKMKNAVIEGRKDYLGENNHA